MLLKLFRFQTQLIHRTYKSDVASSSFNRKLIKKYKRLLDDYWDTVGGARRFHEMNSLLVPQIYNTYIVTPTFNIEQLPPRPEFQQIKVLDIGCGGGITSESLAKLNFQVVGIDPNPDLIQVAQSHQKENEALAGKSLRYYNCTVEKFLETHREQFDVIVISDVLEYIPFWRKKQFLLLCTSFCKNGGKVFVTTLNEYNCSIRRVLQIKLTGTWRNTPINLLSGMSETGLTAILRACGCMVRITRGIDWDIINCKYSFLETNPSWIFLYAEKRVIMLPESKN